MRVQSFLDEHHVSFETLVHPPAYTAARQARALHVSGKQFAKCVMLTGPRGYILAVVPAHRQVDLNAVGSVLEGPVTLASLDEIHETFRDCEWGGLVPFGSLYDLPCLLDESFDINSLLVFEAHLHAVAIRMHCRDFERLEKPKRMKLTY